MHTTGERTKTILLAEDSEDDVFAFRRMLRRAGWPVTLHVVPDGRGVLEYLNRQGIYSDTARFAWPDLLLLDLKMPFVDGFAVLQWLRGRALEGPCRIAILTGADLPGDRERAAEHGVATYLIKPATEEQLGRLLACSNARGASNSITASDAPRA